MEVKMKRFLVILLAVTALLSFFAYGNKGFQANAADISKAVKGKTVGVSLFYRRDEFYKDLENGMIATADKVGLKLIMQDADTDPKKQTEQVENFIAQKVDAIALAVTDPSGMIPVIDAANKAGIPVFAFDGGTKDNVGLTSFIGMDNIDAGQKAGNWVKSYVQKNLSGKANVVILDFPQSAVVCGNRVKGFTAVMKTIPGVKIVAQQDGKASRTDSMTVMENILQANPKVDVVFGINDDTCFGAIAALESVQKENVAVISVGWSEELFNKITNKDQYFRASAVQNPYTMGGTTILTIAKYFETKKVPKEVLDKSTLVTPDNIAKFDWQSIVSKRQK
jgi:ribose transport system substrate-binding protein